LADLSDHLVRLCNLHRRRGLCRWRQGQSKGDGDQSHWYSPLLVRTCERRPGPHARTLQSAEPAWRGASPSSSLRKS